MAEYSSFFDSTPEDPRIYSADKFAEYFKTFLSNGIFNGGNNLRVSTNGNSMISNIADGFAWIEGYMYKVKGGTSVTHGASNPSNPRIDRVVLRLDTSSNVRAIQAKIIAGTPSVNPTAPPIVRSGDIYDLSLATVFIPANVTKIPGDRIVDERLNPAVCGLVNSMTTIDTTDIFDQFQNWYKTKTPEFQQEWDGWFDASKSEFSSDWTTWFNATKTYWNNWFSGQTQGGYVPQTEKNAINGVVALGADGNVPSSKLGTIPSNLDLIHYDIYSLWLELYYKGQLSSIDTSGSKAIMMDGFINILNTDVNKRSMVDTIVGIARTTAVSPSYFSYNFGVSDVVPTNPNTYIAQSFRGTGTISSIKIFYETIDRQPASRTFTLYEGKPSGNDMSGMVKMVTRTITLPAVPSGMDTLRGFEYFYLDDLFTLDPSKTYTLVGGYHDDSWSFFWRRSGYKHSYGSVWWKNTSGGSWVEYPDLTYAIDLVGAGAGFLPFYGGDFISAQKNLTFTPIKARLFMSVKEPSGSKVTPSITVNGTTYETMTLVGSRPDPKFYGYTEKEYSLSFVNKGQILKFKATMTTTAQVTPEIKRYGLIIQ